MVVRVYGSTRPRVLSRINENDLWRNRPAIKATVTQSCFSCVTCMNAAGEGCCLSTCIIVAVGVCWWISKPVWFKQLNRYKKTLSVVADKREGLKPNVIPTDLALFTEHEWRDVLFNAVRGTNTYFENILRITLSRHFDINTDALIARSRLYVIFGRSA
jgi:hypothetical protein